MPLRLRDQIAHEYTPTVQTQGLKVCENGKSIPIDPKILPAIVPTDIMVPTPTKRDWKSSNASTETMNRNSRPLNETITNGATGMLNPDWVELLMLWPLGWTRIEGEPPEGEISPVTTESNHRASRIKAIGNGQVPQCMAGAFAILNELKP